MLIGGSYADQSNMNPRRVATQGKLTTGLNIKKVIGGAVNITMALTQTIMDRAYTEDGTMLELGIKHQKTLIVSSGCTKQEEHSKIQKKGDTGMAKDSKKEKVIGRRNNYLHPSTTFIASSLLK